MGEAEDQRDLRLELEGQIGDDGAHRRLVGEAALEDRAVADVVQRLARPKRIWPAEAMAQSSRVRFTISMMVRTPAPSAPILSA